MLRAKMFLLWGLLMCLAGVLVSLNGCGGGSSGNSTTPPPPTQKIQHVVVIFQENRTPDNLFQQDAKLIAAGADIQNFGVNSKGEQITLTPAPLATDFNPDHSHSSFVNMYDGGKMDGADKIPVGCNPGSPPTCPPPNPQFTYVDNSTGVLAPYFQMAETYTFGDRMFQTNQGPSFPAHQFIISGTSAPVPPGDAMSIFFAAENPIGIPNGAVDTQTGCTAPPQELVKLIDSTNLDPHTNETQSMYPCYEHPTLTDLLNANKISWKYYAPSPGSIWTGPNAIQHMCGPNAPIPNATQCTGSDWTNNVVLQYTQVLTDIANGQLASVTWVIPSGAVSDHAGANDGSGPSWVASVVNAIGNSSYWASTAIIITWDDWGGFYDHVPPPAIANSYEFGFRVPLIVVSPYAKAATVSHTVYDFGSILKFIENTFSLGTVAPGASTPYADTFTQTGNLSDCFDFNQTPRTFQTVRAKYDGKHFLEDKRPPTDPDDD
jgi:phospholipase C